MKHNISFYLLTVLLLGPVFARSQAVWPKDIPVDGGGKLRVYEPQPESFSANTLTGSTAVSLWKSDSEEPVFGAIFFTATVQEDRLSHMAELTSLSVNRAKFSGVEVGPEVDKISALIQQNAPGWKLGMPIDDLVASAKQDNGAAEEDKFNNAAPKILYADKPTSLVVLDGDPRILHDKNLDADKVVNSSQIIFREGNQWNLYVGGNWYKSTTVTGQWQPNINLSAKVKSVNDELRKQENEQNNGKDQAAVPLQTEIIVATVPTELLQTDGEPVYKTVTGTSLLYVSNSPNEIFKDINSQKTFILIAGRWYRSSAMNGPWEYIPSDKLPEDFSKIPEGSDKEEVLSNVAGTDAAEEARIDAQIPQTAKVDRRTAKVDVQYDGDPIFNSIEGTSLRLAENANLTVVEDASGNYFALDNGVWFVSDSPDGPWMVANDRPRNIDDIPANSPAYHTKYVYIYDHTPDYVYTGYTSGYLGSYLYGPTIVYGTGYHYRPWFRRVYYPRPITWGFGFMYDPWTGWNMNWGYNYGYPYAPYYYGAGYGYDRFGYGYGGGWFGPSTYCPSYSRSYRNGGYYGRNYRSREYYGSYQSGGVRSFAVTQGSSVTREARRNSAWSSPYNIYQNQRGVTTQDRILSRSVSRSLLANRQNINSTGQVNNSRLSVNKDNRLSIIEKNKNRLNQNNTPQVSVNNPPDSRLNRNNPALTDRKDNDSRGEVQNGGRPNSTAPIVSRQQQRLERNTARQNNSGRDVPSINRPSAPVQRPEISNRPSVPVQRPEINNRPSTPIQRPEINNRPSSSVRRPEISNRQSAPVQRPEISNRPSTSVRRPEISNRPSTSVRRPEISNRQSAPVQRPEINNRPSARVQRPEISNRPSTSVRRPEISNRSSSSHNGSLRGNNSVPGRRPDRN